MPHDNYLFFIGGSGARAYKSFLHLCAAGAVREDSVNVMLLDQDSHNAACEECANLYELYRRQRRSLYESASGRKVRQTAFHCNVRMLETEAVSPVRHEYRRLYDVLSGWPDENLKRAMSWFYEEEEQNQDLARGFYARPNIGCIFFQDFGGDRRMSACVKSISDNLKKERDVRVVIIGSVFGGTGAAGLPSVLRIIKEGCRTSAAAGKLHYCGVLIAPYFQVRGERDAENPNIQIRSDDFYSGTSAALKYYRFTDDFEKIYVVGQNSLDYISAVYSDGGETQTNKPHLVEVCAAMAVKDYLLSASDNPVLPAVRRRTDAKVLTQILQANGDDQKAVTWSFFDEDFLNLVSMMRTQALLESFVYPYVQNMRSQEDVGLYQWYQVYRLRDERNLAGLEDMKEYTRRFYEWAYPLVSQYSQDGSPELQKDNRVRLFGQEEVGEIWKRIEAGFAEEDRDVGKRKYGDSFRKYQDAFEKLTDFSGKAQKALFYFDKIVLILSSLGTMTPRRMCRLGIQGVLLILLELTGLKDAE